MSDEPVAGMNPYSAIARRIVIVTLFAVHALLLAESAFRHSPPADEMGHFAAGVRVWDTGHFDLYRVNPPLTRVIATIPVVLMGVQTPWPDGPINPPGARREFNYGHDIAQMNRSRMLWLLAIARCTLIPFSLLGAYICLRWATELYGQPAGIGACILWSFSPEILGHGSLMTPDVTATAFGVTSAYTFWRWLRSPSIQRAILAGFVLGLAEAAKTTWLVLFGVYPVIALVMWWFHSCQPLPTRMAHVGLICGLAVWVLNAAYLFEGTGRPLGEFEFVSAAFTGEPSPPQLPATGNRFRQSSVGWVPVPVPASYLCGIDEQKRDFESGFDSYLRGEWRNRGWWYYYCYAAAVKLPLGFWVVLVLAVLARVLGRIPWRLCHDLVLLTPAIVVFGFVSSQTGFNHHFRYVMPALPFLMIWASAAIASQPRLIIRTLAIFGVGWATISSLVIFPHSLSYFNEAAGGPASGHLHLLNSNIDWGQDLIHLKKWLDDHPEATPISLAHTGDFDPNWLGIPHRQLPRGGGVPLNGLKPLLQPGWYAVSMCVLHNERGSYDVFKEHTPIARVGYSIVIYQIRSGFGTDHDASR